MDKNEVQGVSIVIPVFNEDQIIDETLSHVISACEDLDVDFEIIVIDDGSTDSTYQIISQFEGVMISRHPYNLGNGAAVKEGIRKATKDIILLMDGDGQHSPEYFKQMLTYFPAYDMVVGAKTRDSETAWHRNIANSFYNLFASYVCGMRIQDLTSGFRAIKAPIAKKLVYLLPNTFSYPTTLTLAVVKTGHFLKYFPIKVNKRRGKSKIRIFSDGMRFITIILRISTLFSPLKIFIPISVTLGLGGLGWYIYQYISSARLPLGSILLILVSVIIFTLGLISEQITYLRFQDKD